ncbi:hypothetical protein DFS34DRAFT_500439 [Phlyctochytrium arcticum]|nr:hypothetical protein DFS34DRAFT_500439 [Phlyctochytrium arcticum]
MQAGALSLADCLCLFFFAAVIVTFFLASKSCCDGRTPNAERLQIDAAAHTHAGDWAAGRAGTAMLRTPRPLCRKPWIRLHRHSLYWLYARFTGLYGPVCCHFWESAKLPKTRQHYPCNLRLWRV